MNPCRATRADLDRFAETYGTAMHGDPMIRWPLPDNTTIEAVVAMARPIVEMYLDVDAGWLVEDGLGVASWIPPSAAARFDELEQPTRDAIAPFTADGGIRYGQFWDWLAEHIPAEPCWMLDLVAVQPSVQGRGLGAALINHGLALARSDGLPAFLETSQAHHVPYYECFGFHVIDEAAAPDAGPTIWFMRT
ncbi:MAG: GNAT family N-acetyltransferase [Actinomycetes bacterium]